MREAEILSSGELMVDGQKVGQVEAFRLTATAENVNLLQEAKAEIAPKLAQEYALRAERFVASPNGDIAIGQDGYVRWLGHSIAKLKAGEDILHPQFVLLADEDISIDTREKVSQRLERFIAFHFETELKPLYDLAAAEALFEKPRFVATQLVENLGIVPRRKIAAEVKALEQDSRAALRRLGVRFGVYHIFIPSLLKPAPAQALTLLWALKNEAQDRAGYGDVVSYLMAGRTSFAVEEEFDKNFYRLAGYRILGTRAVRIDMLERCADLIRQATSWKPEEAETPRPEGAYDGRRFTITQAMLSILGTTPENMEEILKQLGYVSESVKEADYQAYLAEHAPKLAAPTDAENQADNAAKAQNTADNSTSEISSDNAEKPADEAVVLDGDAKAAEAVESQEQPKMAVASETTAVPVETAATDSDAAVSDETAAQEPAEEAVVLLWHYHKRSFRKPFNKDNRRNGGHQDRQNAGRRQNNGSQNANNQGDKKRGGYKNNPKRNAGKSHGFNDKKHNKPINVEDSPFAALAALKGKLNK